jgi:hypothetical protein
MDKLFTISQFVKCAACVSILSLLSVAANAVPVVWTLDDVVFNDGGTASGSFTFDADTNTYSAITIATTPGSVFTSAFTFDLVNPAPVCVDNPQLLCTLDASTGPDYTGGPSIVFTFANALTNAGGQSQIDLGILATCVTPTCDAVNNPVALLVSGGVTAQVPPPTQPVPTQPVPTISTYGLALTILGLLAIVARRLSSRRAKVG